MELFAQATKKKFRYETSKGLISTEDLWDLPLSASNGRPNLDDIARGLHKLIQSGTEVSFVSKNATTSASFALMQAKFDVVKSVIDIRLAEAEVARTAKAARAERQRIMEILSQKDDEELFNKSKDELSALLKSRDELLAALETSSVE